MQPGQNVLEKLLKSQILAGDWRYVLKIAGYTAVKHHGYT